MTGYVMSEPHEEIKLSDLYDMALINVTESVARRLAQASPVVDDKPQQMGNLVLTTQIETASQLQQ